MRFTFMTKYSVGALTLSYVERRSNAAKARNSVWLTQDIYMVRTFASRKQTLQIRTFVNYELAHIRNTPNRGASSTGAFSAAANASPSTSLVCAGSIIPSSQSRAVA